ncbi:MAG: hypothetical protein R8K47_03835, partial [Mariprofundaceae bacterium]
IEQVFDWPESDDTRYAGLPRLRFHLDRARVNTLPSIIRRLNALHIQDEQRRKARKTGSESMAARRR